MSLVDNNYMVTHCPNLRKNMRAYQNGVIFSQLLYQCADLYDLLRIQSDGRLIKNNDIRISNQSLCKSDSLLISFGKIFDQPILHIGDHHFFHDISYHGLSF